MCGAAQVWRHSEGGGWQQDGPALAGHGDWVRDVAWAPNLGLPASTLASAGQDGRVFIWAERPGGGWERTLLQDFQVPQPYHNPEWYPAAGRLRSAAPQERGSSGAAASGWADSTRCGAELCPCRAPSLA